MSNRSPVLAVIALLVLTLAFPGWTRGEEPILDDPEPPVRLKKKVRPDKADGPDKRPEQPAKKTPDKKERKPDSAKDKEAKKPAPKRPDQAAEERKKLVQRVLK